MAEFGELTCLVGQVKFAHPAGILGKISAFELQLLQRFLAFLFPLLTAADAIASKFATHAILTIDAAATGQL